MEKDYAACLDFSKNAMCSPQRRILTGTPASAAASRTQFLAAVDGVKIVVHRNQARRSVLAASRQFVFPIIFAAVR